MCILGLDTIRAIAWYARKSNNIGMTIDIRFGSCFMDGHADERAKEKVESNNACDSINIA